MEIDCKTFKGMLLAACAAMQGAKEELTAIDSKFGDGDHGVTIERIAQIIEGQVADWKNGDDLRAAMDDLGDAVMGVSGGSAGPLWGTFVSGLALGIPVGAQVLRAADLRAMCKSALAELYDITTARVGDKTMMDTLIPAAEAVIAGASDDPKALLEAARQAADAGAKASEQFISKFGRAKSYKEKTIGTPDAGAVSMRYFFAGLCEGLA